MHSPKLATYYAIAAALALVDDESRRAVVESVMAFLAGEPQRIETEDGEVSITPP